MSHIHPNFSAYPVYNKLTKQINTIAPYLGTGSPFLQSGSGEDQFLKPLRHVSSIHKSNSLYFAGPKITDDLRFNHIIPYCLQFPSGKGKFYSHQQVADLLNGDPGVKKLLPEGERLTDKDIAHIYERYINKGIISAEQASTVSGRIKITDDLRFNHIIPYCLQFPSGKGKPYSHQQVADVLNADLEVKKLLPKGQILTGDDIYNTLKRYINKGITSAEGVVE